LPAFKVYNIKEKMQIEPLPKVTFLPLELTKLVIKNWTGETIDYEKNGQVSHHPHGPADI